MLISLSVLPVFVLLYVFRAADDNRLTSWRWVFANVDFVWFIPLIIVAIPLVYALLNSPIARQRPSLFLFLCSFSVSAIFWKAPEVIVDASRYFTQAKHLEIYGIRYFISEWGYAVNSWTDLPLVPFLYGLVFKFFGEARAFIQVMNSFFFSMTVVLAYFIGKKLWDEDTGFYAAALLPGIPYLFSQTPLMLVDVPTMFFLTLAIYTFIKALERGGVWTVLAALAIFLAVFSKYSNWMMLSVLGVIFLVYILQSRKDRQETEDRRGQTEDNRHKTEGETRNSKPKTRNPKPETRTVILRTVTSAAIASVLIGLVMYFKYDVISSQITFLREYQAPGLRRWGESFVSTFFYQVHPFITVAAIYSVYSAVRKKDMKFLIVFWLVLLLILLQIRRSRYVMVAFPMLTLMASYGLQKIKARETRQYVVSSIVASSLVVAVFAYLPFLQSMSMVNLKNAGEYLDSIAADTVEAVTVPSRETVVNPAVSVPIFDLHTGKDIIYRHDENYSLPFKEIEKSPLRFTWEYKNPSYYIRDNKRPERKPAVAVISNSDMKVLPEDVERELRGYKKTMVYDASTEIFRYSPVVTIYLPEES